MNLGGFSVSLTVKDIHVSKAFYENIGFKIYYGDITQKWLILKNGDCTVGIFEDMFEKNILTFNPGWDNDGNESDPFVDIRQLQEDFKEKGIEFICEVEENTSGPGNFIILDPDGNPIMIDQHR